MTRATTPVGSNLESNHIHQHDFYVLFISLWLYFSRKHVLLSTSLMANDTLKMLCPAGLNNCISPTALGYKKCLYGGRLNVKVRRSDDRLIFIMVLPIPGKTAAKISQPHLYGILKIIKSLYIIDLLLVWCATKTTFVCRWEIWVQRSCCPLGK